MKFVELGNSGGVFPPPLTFPFRSRIACGGVLELLIFRGWLEVEQADALAPCGGASVFGTYRDTILYLFTRLENEAPRAFATWVPCTPRIIPPLDDAQACSNSVTASGVSSRRFPSAFPFCGYSGTLCVPLRLNLKPVS